MRDIICGLDIGASNVRALIANSEGNILGHSQVPTKGFSRSVVSNLGLLSDAIESSVMKSEEMAKAKVRKVIVNVSGVHIRTFQSRGSVHISDRPSEITKDDIKRCIESAKVIAMSLDRAAVHLVPVRYFIDDKMEINDPLGLFGSKLDVDLNIITSLVAVLQNVTKAVNLAGYEVDELIVSGAGAGLAVFDDGQLQNGAVLIDVGKEITEAALFIDGKILDSYNFPFGGDDLTQVLQDNLKVMFDEAEEIKIKYGLAGKDEVANLLLPKIDSAMGDVYKKIEPFLKNKKSLPIISMVGGVAKMDGFIERIENVFKVPVSMGRIKVTDRIDDITFACSLGLMKYGMKKIIAQRSRAYAPEPIGIAGRFIAKIKSIISEYFYQGEGHIMIGIIGAGNMGMAIASGLRERFLVSDEDLSKLKAIKNRKVSIARSNIDLARQSNVIILAVKPQDIGKVLKEIKPHIKEKLIISIAAGVKTGSMEKALGKVAIIRVMPNMPAMVGKGISAISRGRFAGLSDFKTASRIFSNVGEIVEVKENMMDAVTAVSGSGPAYYFLFTYLLQKAAQASGLKKGIAIKLARATFIGAAEIIKSKDLSMEELVEKVASKGGTTEAALKVFKDKNLSNIIKQAVKSASLKSSLIHKTSHTRFVN